jgi:hypothetical protein
MKLVAMILYPWGEKYVCRTDELVLVDGNVGGSLRPLMRPRRLVAPSQYRLRDGGILLRRWSVAMDRYNNGRKPRGWGRKHGNRILRLDGNAVSDEVVMFYITTKHPHGFMLSLRKLQRFVEVEKRLAIGISPIEHVIIDDGEGPRPWIRPIQDGLSFEVP